MARVTVEDCVLKVPNRFELVMMAAQRAREISAGASLTLERDNDKNPVVALREIAEEGVPLESLRDSLVRGHQRHVEMEEAEEEIVELMAGEEEEWRRQVAENAGSDLGDSSGDFGDVLGADEDASEDGEELGFSELDDEGFEPDEIESGDGGLEPPVDDFPDEDLRG